MTARKSITALSPRLLPISASPASSLMNTGPHRAATPFKASPQRSRLWTCKSHAKRTSTLHSKVCGRHRVHCMDDLGEDFDFGMKPFRTQLFDTTVRRTRQQVIGLWDVADGGNARTSDCCTLAEPSAIHWIDDSRLLIASAL